MGRQSGQSGRGFQKLGSVRSKPRKPADALAEPADALAEPAGTQAEPADVQVEPADIYGWTAGFSRLITQNTGMRIRQGAYSSTSKFHLRHVNILKSNTLSDHEPTA